ncbi:dTMP kinase [Corynebacterium nuruki]|uniref:dTMP kinase n=1 Tax=Corynebacterium nuruki TaxID=1032851 RepID=UPI0002486608|nr:dTMP kinase [Corynebacterium nuruki]
MIIAFEGIDGAGKNTVVTALEKELIAREVPVARLAFPRYEASVHAQLASAALHGEMGDLVDSAYGMATLFALDRAEVAEDLAGFDTDGYVVLLDRWVASNAAYSAARLQQNPVTGDVVGWVAALEFDQLGVPSPDLQVLVDVPDQVAADRVSDRAVQDATREPDVYEADNGLQVRTLTAYRALADAQWNSPWLVLDNSGDRGALDAQLAELADAVASEGSEDPAADGR